MGTFFAYILKSALYVTAYYLFYRLLLSRDTFHRFNRWALLGMLTLSIALPLLQFSAQVAQPSAQGDVTVGLPTAAMVLADDTATPWHIQLLQWVLLIYVVGMVCFALRAAVCYISLARVLSKGERTRLNRYGIEGHDDVCLIVHREQMSPFSWMHYMVVSEQDMQFNGPAIVAHELGHIRHRHTLDLLFTEVCTILQWFNPAIWLMRRELQTIHEYQADEAALDSGLDARQYQLLLIAKATGARLQSITCSLHQSSIKKRITMMLKKKSNPWAKAKWLFAIPVAITGIALFTTPEATAVSKQVSDCKVSEFFANDQTNGSLVIQIDPSGRCLVGGQVIPMEQLAATIRNAELGDNAVVTIVGEKQAPMSAISAVKDVLRQCNVSRVQYQLGSDEATGRIMAKNENLQATKEREIVEIKVVTNEVQDVFTVVEKMPEFPGGEVELMNFLKTNVKYPAESAKNGKQGRVMLGFIIETDGSISNIESLSTDIDPLLVNEAIRIVQAMPKWTPGKQRGQAVRVKYVLPITFRLQ